MGNRIVVGEASLNAAEWIKLLGGMGTTKNVVRRTISYPQVHGYLYHNRAQKSYVVVWDPDYNAYHPECQRVSFKEITRKTGKYINAIKHSDQAPAIRETLQKMYISRTNKINDDFCPLGRLIYRICSWIRNVLSCIGCATTEGMAKRYIHALPKTIF